MFKILHFSKGGRINSEWLDLPRNTIMKNRFFFKKETWKNFGCWEISQLTRNDLICLESLLWKTLFFTSNMEKFFKGGPVVLKWFDMPRNTVTKNTISKKTLNVEKSFLGTIKLNETVSLLLKCWAWVLLSSKMPLATPICILACFGLLGKKDHTRSFKMRNLCETKLSL